MHARRRAIYGTIAKTIQIENKGPEVVGIDSELLLSRLLFFDEVVINSVNLGELPYLTKMFGVDGVDQLLRCGVLKLESEHTSVVTDVKLNGKRQIPLRQFDLGIATAHDNDHNLEMKFRNLLKISGLSNARREDLTQVIRANLVRHSASHGNDLLTQIRKDLTSNSEFTKQVLHHRYPDVELDNLIFNAFDVGKMPTFETNLQSMLGVTAEQEHDMLSEVVKGVSNLNQRLATMAEYNAISHFEEQEAPLLFGKIHSIVSPLNPSYDEQAFLRVIAVAEIPQLIANRRIDVEELLKIRMTDECREFRAWLATTDNIDEAKLKTLLIGLRAKAALFIASSFGKIIRLGVNAGLGLIPGYGTLAALGEGVVDSFLLDKMLPSSGLLTFLNKTMPSIFVSAMET